MFNRKRVSNWFCRRQSFIVTSNLLNHHINLVTVLHVEVLGGLILVQSLTIEKEANVVGAQLRRI